MTPESPEILGFINGVLATGFVVSAVYFFKFWRRTRDHLFFAFAFAFAVLGAAQPLPWLLHTDDAASAFIYLLRLAAFAVIILAILRKNQSR